MSRLPSLAAAARDQTEADEATEERKAGGIGDADIERERVIGRPVQHQCEQCFSKIPVF